MYLMETMLGEPDDRDVLSAISEQTELPIIFAPTESAATASAARLLSRQVWHFQALPTHVALTLLLLQLQ